MMLTHLQARSPKPMLDMQSNTQGRKYACHRLFLVFFDLASQLKQFDLSNWSAFECSMLICRARYGISASADSMPQQQSQQLGKGPNTSLLADELQKQRHEKLNMHIGNFDQALQSTQGLVVM